MGLATAARLHELGLPVTFMYTLPGHQCVSGGAGAIWEVNVSDVHTQQHVS